MKQEIKELIERAIIFSPSGDNCQPFNCQWENDRLFIIYDSKIAEHKLNYLNYTSIIALGCVLESIRVVAEDHSFEISIDINNELPFEKIKIDFTESSILPSGLSQYIEIRHTDRRLYKGGWTAEAEEKILKEAAKNHCTVKSVKVLPPAVFKYFLTVDSLLWKDSKIFFDTMNWVRFSLKKTMALKDGLSAENLGLNPVVKAFVWFASRNKFLQFISSFSGVFAGRKVLKDQIDSSAGFIFIYPKNFSNSELIEVGRSGQRIWLELTRQGFAVQPLTMGTFLTYLAKHSPILKEFKSAEASILKEGVLDMEREISLPAWGLRWGKVDRPLDKKAWTYRRLRHRTNMV